jgi:ribosome-associated translation inhibitor RaiA
MRKKIRTQVDRENLQHAVDFFIDEVEKCINNYLQKEEKAAT